MPPETCFQHPDRPAVEHCEVCRKAVCGSCLWYAETGERLCPEHALEFDTAGKPVHGPGRYAAGIPHSEASALRPKTGEAPYQGNSTDMGALVAAISGIMALVSCAGFSWVLPLLAFGLGLIIWFHSKDALDPRRARWLAGAGMATGGVFLVVAAGIFAIMCLFFTFAAIASRAGPGGFSTPTPFLFPTP